MNGTIQGYDTLLTRHPRNPLISPRDFPGGRADAVFNCGQTMMGDKTILLLSVLFRDDPVPSIHVAESDDGIDFRIRREPFISRIPEEPFRTHDTWPIDTRVTRIGDEYYIIRPGAQNVAFLHRTRDFVSHEFLDIVALPGNRVPCLFPEKIGGYYWRFDRPAQGRTTQGEIWLSRSPDLIHWGHHRFVLEGFNDWCGNKIGPTPPIRTERGWLEVIHGVSHNCSNFRYCLGAILLDLNEPWRIIGRMNGYLLCPDTLYEHVGRVPDVVFSCGAIADLRTRRLRVYYGAADTCIGLAEGDVDAILDACLMGDG
jgi:beta-1,4-mannooligosaccharide/beta-1,4-mannosyl-N-acetylglucosamine phosphorylase